jgi:hypothetical protein
VSNGNNGTNGNNGNHGNDRNDVTPGACPSAVTLTRAIEGALSIDQQRDVEAHIARCSQCAGIRYTLASLHVQLIQNAPDAACEQLARQALEHERLRGDEQPLVYEVEDDEDDEPLKRRFGAFLQKLDTYKQTHPRPHPISPKPPAPPARPIPSTPRASSSWIAFAVPAPVLVVLVIGLFLAQQPDVPLRADELLARAAQAEKVQPARLVHDVRLRFTLSAKATQQPKPSEFRYQTNPDAPADAPMDATMPTNAESLRLALELVQPDGGSSPFEWQSPLAVRRVQAWRATLAERTDTVTADAHFFTLRTITHSGRIRLAEIVVTREGFHVVRQSFEIDWFGRLDIEEDAAYVRPAAPMPLPVRLSAAERERLERAELTARTALRATDLDLILRVRQMDTPAAIEIEGAVATSSSRDALAAQLGTIPQVRMDVEIDAHLEPPRLSSRPLLAGWVAAYGAGAGDRTALASKIACGVPRITQRLQAIQSLGTRYTADAMAALPKDLQLKLDGLIESHFAALYEDLTALDDHLATFIGSAGRPIPPAHPPRDWRACVRRALTESRLLGASLAPGASPANGAASAEDGPSGARDVRTHLDALWRTLNPPAR